MRNIFLIIIITIVAAAGGFLFWRRFEGAPAQNNISFPASTSLAPVNLRSQSSAPDSAAAEKIYRQNITIDSRAFFFRPDMFRVKRGEKVTVNVKAAGDHSFIIDELKVNAKTPDGKTTKVEFTPQKTGVFKYYCSVGGHREGGQEGILIVE